MLRLLKVTQSSLEPDFHEGDFVLIAKIPFLFMLRPTDTIVFRHPIYGMLIKRVERVNHTTGKIFVIGTHPYSVDSHIFGEISQQDVTGKVIWHIRKPITRWV